MGGKKTTSFLSLKAYSHHFLPGSTRFAVGTLDENAVGVLSELTTNLNRIRTAILSQECVYSGSKPLDLSSVLQLALTHNWNRETASQGVC